MPSYLNIKEAAEYLGISSHTLYKLVERNEVPAAKVGGSWRLNREALDEFLRGSSPASAAEVLIVEPDPAARRELARTSMERKVRLQLASNDEDASVLIGGAPGPDLIIYSVTGSTEESRAFIERARGVAEDCQVALLIDPSRASDIGSLMSVGPLIVLSKPVRRQDLVNILTLVTG